MARCDTGYGGTVAFALGVGIDYDFDCYLFLGNFAYGLSQCFHIVISNHGLDKVVANSYKSDALVVVNKLRWSNPALETRLRHFFDKCLLGLAPDLPGGFEQAHIVLVMDRHRLVL